MTESLEHFKSEVGILSRLERAELAYYLLASLEPEEDGVEETWRIENARRVAEIRRGRAKGRSADDVLGELKERHP